MDKKIGFTIGKFAPLHKGHQYMIDKALKDMDCVIIVLYETDVIKVPIEVRKKWINNLYPQVKIIYAINPPTQYGIDKESVKIQIDYLKSILKNTYVTHFYSSEAYGEFVSKFLKVADIRVDQKREYINVSASMIRNNIEKYRDYLEPTVYRDCKAYIDKDNF